MALLHAAQISPTKLELLEAWLPTCAWYPGSTRPVLQLVGSFRFDDPAGQVGVETLLVRTQDGLLLQVPLTYRPEPAVAQERSLITTMEHSVLGRRWVYDALGDPVYAITLATAILTGGTQAELVVQTVDGLAPREPTVLVGGSGTSGAPAPPLGVEVVVDGDPSMARAGRLELAVRRVLAASTPLASGGGWELLNGTWEGQAEPFVLAAARVR